MGKTKQNQPITSKTEFFYYAFRNILLVGLPLIVISAFILSISHSSATDSNSGADNITLRLSTSCTISSNVISEHSIDLNGGQYATDIGNTKVSTYCNDNNGYSIYAIGSSGDVDGNTDLISDLNNSNYNIHTNTYITGDTVSSWAMKLTAGIGTGIDSITGESVNLTPPTIRNNYDNYNIVPNVYTLVASRTSGTNMTTDTATSGSYFNTTYSIYASSVQPAGTYTGRVKYLMVHPQSNINTVTNINEAFAVSGKMKAYEDSNGSYYAMQDMTTDICNMVGANGESTSAQLVDIRDNNIYWVTKLKDGHCWMTQNLDLDIGGTGIATLTSNNTDISATASGSGIYSDGYTENNGVWTWSPLDSAVTSSHVVNGTSVPGWSSQNALPYSAEGSDVYYYTSNGTGGDTTFSSLQACKDANHTEADCKHYHRGNYYNWTAAVASNSSGDFTTNLTQADNSICPKNWRLPIASNSDQSIFEFGDLLYTHYNIIKTKQGTNITNQVSYTNDGFNNIRKAPLWFVRSGNIVNTSLDHAVIYGGDWSSTVASDSNAYDLGFNSSGVWPASTHFRGNGRSIRCLAR